MGFNTPKWIPSKEEIDEKLKTTNERELFVVGQIIIERILDKIIIEKYDIPEKILDDTRFPMQLRIDLLIESDRLEENLKKNIRKINQIRNRYAHRIDPEKNDIDMLIGNLVYLSSTPEVEQERLEKYRICVKQTFHELEKML
jgi:hypothetical protein|tara:strand:+ start:45 stop:473 length:429 start_codon:yes stop_codon:yes gene_type:complete